VLSAALHQGNGRRRFCAASTHQRLPWLSNDLESSLPEKLLQKQQIALENQTLAIFESRHADDLVERLGPDVEFIVFGVGDRILRSICGHTPYLRGGRLLSVAGDAIGMLERGAGDRTLSELKSSGAPIVTTDQALVQVNTGKRWSNHLSPKKQI
jgi:hypothetical protein